MLIVNTGNGKGKTTAAVGQVIRSLGRGWRVCIIQLFKGTEFYGEQKILKRLPRLDFFSFAPKHPLCFKEIDPREVRKECEEALKCAENVIRKKKYDLVVLEEFNIATRDGFLKPEALLEVINKASKKKHIIVTGRGASKIILGAADLITEMKEIRHPYNKGIKAQKGLEF